MPRLSDEAYRKLVDMRNTADRWAGVPPDSLAGPSRPVYDKPPALLGRIDSGPGSDGMWTGRIVKFDVNEQAWVVTSEFDVKFMRLNTDDPAPTIGKRYPVRPSHINIDDEDTTQRDYVFNLLSTGNGQTFVKIEDSLGTGTWQTDGRSIGRIATYNVDTDSWSYSSYLVLVEPVNSGVFIDGRRYPAWYVGEATGGYDGTGTGTLGTGTGTAGGTLSVYLADPIGTRLQVVTDITVQCVGTEIVTTITRQTIIAIVEP